MGRLFNEYNSDENYEGLKGYIKDEEEKILFKWKNSNPYLEKQKNYGEEKNGK